MMRAIAQVALVITTSLMLVFAVEAPTRVAACSCAAPSGVDLSQPLTAEEAAAYGRDTVVFTGRAVARRDSNPLGPIISSADPITWTFAVDGVLHGDAGAVVDVETARDGASCGMTFEMGARYQVVAGRSGSTLRTQLCSRTMRLAGGPAAAALSTVGTALEERRESVAFGLLAIAAVTLGTMLVLGRRNVSQ